MSDVIITSFGSLLYVIAAFLTHARFPIASPPALHDTGIGTTVSGRAAPVITPFPRLDEVVSADGAAGTARTARAAKEP